MTNPGNISCVSSLDHVWQYHECKPTGGLGTGSFDKSSHLLGRSDLRYTFPRIHQSAEPGKMPGSCQVLPFGMPFITPAAIIVV